MAPQPCDPRVVLQPGLPMQISGDHLFMTRMGYRSRASASVCSAWRGVMREGESGERGGGELQPSKIASVISSPRSMISKASFKVFSSMVSGGLHMKLSHRKIVNSPLSMKNFDSAPIAG